MKIQKIKVKRNKTKHNSFGLLTINLKFWGDVAANDFVALLFNT